MARVPKLELGNQRNAVDTGFARRSGRDCLNPEAMEGKPDSPPCVLDTGNPCRYDGVLAKMRIARELSNCLDSTHVGDG